MKDGLKIYLLGRVSKMSNFSDELQNYYNWMGVRSELLEILFKLENLDKNNLCLIKKTHPFKYLPVSSRRVQQFIDLSLIPKPIGVKYSYNHIIFYFYSILMRKKGYSFNQLSQLSLKLSLEEAENKFFEGYNKKNDKINFFDDEENFLNPSEISEGLKKLGRKEGRALISDGINISITPWCNVSLTKQNIKFLKKDEVKTLTKAFEKALLEISDFNKKY